MDERYSRTWVCIQSSEGEDLGMLRNSLETRSLAALQVLWKLSLGVFVEYWLWL